MKKIKLSKIKINNNHYQISITIGTFLIAVLFTVFITIAYSVFQTTDKELCVERRQILNEVSEQIAKTVDSICSYAWKVSDAAFSHLKASEIDSKEEISTFLSEAENAISEMQSYLAVIDSKMHFYLSDGSVGHFEYTELLKIYWEKHRTIIMSVPFGSEKEPMIFLQRLEVPLTAKDGTVITHTAMILTPEVYKSAFSYSGFDGTADIYMTHHNGYCLYRQNNIKEFSNSSNILNMLEGVTFIHGDCFDDLKNSLSTDYAESFEFKLNKTNYFVSMAPVQTMNWIITIIIPANQMRNNAETLIKTTMDRIILMSVIAVIIAAIIIYCYILAINTRLREQQQKQLNEALKNAAEEANSANLAKSEFLSHMSHDLRTPLNAIFGMLERAEECNEMNDELRQSLSDIGTATNHLNALINDVLDMSRLESNKSTTEKRAFDLRTVTGTCCSIIHSSAKHHNISFTFNCGELKHPYLIGWDVYLRKLLINILGNSVKFTNDGGKIFFEMSETFCDGETARFRFVITDNGIGMNENQLKHIFEPFWQANDSYRTSYEGTGLGMSIVKKLIDKMDGTIFIISKENEGSRFTIDLPFTVCDSSLVANEEASQETLPPSPLLGMTVLLCDDNKMNCDIAERLLKKADATVIIANNGEQAYNIFKNSNAGDIDVILMDVMMPVMDGLRATKAIRSLPRNDAASVPIIAMTANAFDEDVKKTVEAGMNEHLSKPISGKKLISTLIKYKKRQYFFLPN